MSAALSPGDPNSFSRPEDAIVTRIHLNISVDFLRHVVSGTVELHVQKKRDEVNHVVLDVKDLTLFSVHDKESAEKLTYSIGESVEPFGSPLTIQFPASAKKEHTIVINYECSPDSSALQWLKPEQTAGKKHPYMFAQCQAIHCRSLLPCQDTPSVKAAYTAEVSAPEDLTVLMSAIRDGEPSVGAPGKRVHKFHQNVPIPSYLIAIVAGNLESRQIGPRSHVWSEKEFVDKAAYEFAETEQMLSTGEQICGPYVWGVYDLLVLPPSFSFGGMENPCLTFVTPTLLAGDRSLADVVTHEIAHSWSGNLVTNRNFEHFWLNEGFTMFFERKIVGRMYGDEHRSFSAVGGWKMLTDAIKTRGKDDPTTCLVPNLAGVDPDDAFSVVPYEKGHTFLWFLEQLVGGPDVFEPFLKAYIDKFKYKSIDTEDFKSFLFEYFSDKAKEGVFDKVDWHAWLKTPGMPPMKPKFDMSLAEACSKLSNRWLEWKVTDACPFTSDDLKSFSSRQVVEFVAILLEADPLPLTKLKKMEELYNMNNLQNAEIKFRWLRLCLRGKWKDQVPNVIRFITEQGRAKFVKPLYRDLFLWDETKETAIDTYQTHKGEMMHMTEHTVGKTLKLI